jgi:hypothetical protein
VDKTAIQTSVPPAPAVNGPGVTGPAPQPRPGRRRGPLLKAVLALASLKFTVALMALSIGLVFIGTLAQVDEGIWTVVERYFRSAYVWVPLHIFFPRDWNVGGSFPYPGGWLLGGVMLVNMTLAYFVRYNHFTWKRTGVYVLHSGIVVMMLSELFTGLYAAEGTMAIAEGSSSNVVFQNRYAELAVTSPPAGGADKLVDEVVVPASLLRHPGDAVRHESLPFDVEVVRFLKNSALRDAARGEDKVASAGAGLQAVAVEQAEVSGTAKKQTVDAPAAYLTFKTKGGEVLGTYLMQVTLDPQPVKVGDTTYQVALRFKQTYRPYSIHLLKFRFDRWEGTQMARNYSSQVRLVDSERGTDREELIRMNDPLRYRGETYYQADFDHATERITYLQVVRNPAWQLPYISCALVALGMVIQFGLHLVNFLTRRRAA